MCLTDTVFFAMTFAASLCGQDGAGHGWTMITVLKGFFAVSLSHWARNYPDGNDGSSEGEHAWSAAKV